MVEKQEFCFSRRQNVYFQKSCYYRAASRKENSFALEAANNASGMNYG